MTQSISQEEFEKPANEIHLEIGRAISEWSLVEQWLFHIYARLVCINGAIPLGLSTSFEQARNFETRLSMVTALIEHSGFPPEIRKEQFRRWKPLRRTLKELNKSRNAVAHGSIAFPEPIKPGTPITKPVWVPFYENHGYRLFKIDPSNRTPTFAELTAADIAQIRKLFIQAVQKLAEFHRINFPQSGT